MILHTIHTIWMNWADDDALELHSAVDDNLFADNPEHYLKLLEEAQARVGIENVREIMVEVDWADICRPFDVPKIEGEVKA